MKKKRAREYYIVSGLLDHKIVWRQPTRDTQKEDSEDATAMGDFTGAIFYTTTSLNTMIDD